MISKLVSFGLKSLAAFLTIYFIAINEWKCILLLFPVFFVDCIIQNLKVDTIGTLVQLILLAQVIMIWYISSITLFQRPTLAPPSAKPVVSNNLSPAFHGNVNNPLSNQHVSLADSMGMQPRFKSLLSTPSFFDVKILGPAKIHHKSKNIIQKVFGNLFECGFPDLRYRDGEEIRVKMNRLFHETPDSSRVIDSSKNPCWYSDRLKGLGLSIACLPYVYLLGQPKSGTTDLFERIRRHQSIIGPRQKEVRWFTRGEFQTSPLLHEGDEKNAENPEDSYPRERLLGPESSVYSFARAFSDASKAIEKQLSEKGWADIITIDGGPHTLWWPTQSPDGTFLPDDIPPAQLIRELQPNAKFIVTLSDPVKRMYSDYYFLGDDLRVRRPLEGQKDSKSAQEFHERSAKQVEAFNNCVEKYTEVLLQQEIKQMGQPSFKDNDVDESVMCRPKRLPYPSKIDSSLSSHAHNPARMTKKNDAFPVNFRAAQMCAHDRHSFAVGGWGRLSIGLYPLFLEKWLEHFAPSQFLILRLEDYHADPKAYMTSVFEFLEVTVPTSESTEWDAILQDRKFNEYRADREPILHETEVLLREFYRPFNQLLSELLDDRAFLWDPPGFDKLGKPASLRDLQVHEQMRRRSENLVQPGKRGREGVSREKTLELQPPEHPQQQHQNLRGSGQKLELTPRAFSLEGLIWNKTLEGIQKKPLSLFLGNSVSDFEYFPGKAASQVCLSAFGLDLEGLKKLYYDFGLPGDMVDKGNAGRNAWHCLSSIHLMTYDHPKSYDYAILKHKVSWLTPFMSPNFKPLSNSVLNKGILFGLSDRIEAAAEWLHRAQVPVNKQDKVGYTPLHIACVSGVQALVKLLLKFGADPNIRCEEQRTPLHYAAAYGHTEIVAQLLAAGGDPSLVDVFGVRPRDIYEQPGPIPPDEALALLHVTQRPARRINRLLQPELVEPRLGASAAEEKWGGWFGNGGWGAERLSGFEGDLECEGVDQFWADEITGEQIYRDYMGRNAPVLIRGLIHEWNVIKNFTHDDILKKFGGLIVQVSDIPYTEKFGSSNVTTMTLESYINQVKEHRIVGGRHPWYVFKSNFIPQLSDAPNSMVPFKDCPTPTVLQEAFERHCPPEQRGREGKSSREIFVTAQWAMGGEGTGAPVHFHSTAWNALVYGAKKWLAYPPRDMIMSNKHILDFYHTDRLYFENPPPLQPKAKPVTCVQTAGDVMIIPETWGHGVLNIQESIAVATEFKHTMWSINPMFALFHLFPELK